MSASILIVDDEESILTSLSSILQDEGYDVVTVKNGGEALRIYTTDPPDLMLLDIWMPEMDGMETLRRVRELVPTAQVMMMSGHGSIETAVKAIKLGAYDYIEKPLSLENVTLRVKHALDQYRLEQENRTLRTTVQRKFELVGQSPVMQQLRQLIETAGPTNSRVLIGGENGTGKELVARAIHLHSARSNRPFVAVNCAAIPETLIESELFGHEKGSFTGATSMKRGQFEQADGGTLFRDEIADMSLSTQAKGPPTVPISRVRAGLPSAGAMGKSRVTMIGRWGTTPQVKKMVSHQIAKDLTGASPPDLWHALEKVLPTAALA